MAYTPKFLGPDGIYREIYIFTTDRSSRFFTGSMDTDTVDMQVSIRGAAFTSDPDLILFEGTSFTVPNPSAHPTGLALLPGDNRIEIKSILTSGATTGNGVVLARLSLDRDVRADVLAPSGIYVERKDYTVVITVEGLTDENVVGYHFYAATAPGGGTSGYRQINLTMVTSAEIVEELDAIGELTVDANVALGSGGALAADPLYLNVTATETDLAGTVIQTDYNQALVIPDDAIRLKTTITVEGVRTVSRYSFTHDRAATATSATNPAIPSADFNVITETDPLYYAATAVYYIDEVEYESPLSPEVAAAPLIVTPAVALLPSVSREQIVRNVSTSIYRSHPELDVKAGTVLRDTFIDPFANEAERIRFIIGFMQAAQSFTTLLAIDDPGNSGTSIPVAQSTYKLALKQALFLQDTAAVQNVIDNAFDFLGARYGASRLPGVRSRGEVVFFTDERPKVTRFLSIGSVSSGGGVRFRTTSAVSISPTGAGATYNPTTGRYAVRAYIQAETAGAAGNVSPGVINTMENGPPGVRVTNDARTFGGRSVETNRDLAIRASALLSSVDTGTYRGYIASAIDVAGVRQASVVDAGHALMMRDRDPDTGRHTRGAVDVWVRGESTATITDTFAFTFETVIDGQFEPVGALASLRFRAVDPAGRISAAFPLIEMLEIVSEGITFRDDTTGKVFDLTGVTYIFPDQIVLSPIYNTPAGCALTDLFTGSYRFRTSNRHVFTRQPVDQILSFTGDPNRTGTLDSAVYRLFQGSDPLNLGRSTEAGDYAQVVQPIDGTTPVVVPSPDPITVTGEDHVLLGGVEYLNFLGISPVTVHVYSPDGATEYWGPYKTGVTADFTLVPESGGRPLGIQLTPASRLAIGNNVIVNYEYDENFSITYETNGLVGIVQDSLDDMRHVTADVVAKAAIPIGVDISATIVLTQNTVVSDADGAVRTALARKFGTLVLGQALRQADIIEVIKGATGVSYPVVPLVKITKSDEATVVREAITTGVPVVDFVAVSTWSTPTVDVYLLTNPLSANTADGGGVLGDYRGVFLDESELTNLESPPDINGTPLKETAYTAFIIGSGGITIPGYSDNATLQAAYPFATLAEIAAKRILITSGRVLVALPTGTTPATGDYRVTYVVYDDSGVKNINPGPTCYLVLGDLEFTYDEDTGS